jgi:hypothetical protein
MGRTTLTYADLEYLQSSNPLTIQDTLKQRGWKIAEQQTVGDLHIDHWTKRNRGIWQLIKGTWRLVVEHGEGYDNTIVYQTPSVRAYNAAAKSVDFTALDRRQQKEGEHAAYEAYFGEEGSVIIVGTPQEGASQRIYTVILTTTSNVDAIWFESDYLR